GFSSRSWRSFARSWPRARRRSSQRRAALVGLLGLVVGAGLLPRSDPPSPGRAERPDIVLVVLDTVGALYTSLHGAELPTTPVLERLAREGVWFENAVAPAPWTVPSHASLLTGELPRVAGAHHEHPALPEGAATTAEILGAAGYRSAAFVANPWVGRFNGLTRGFEHSESVWEIERQWRAFTAVRLLSGLSEGPPGKGGALLVRRSLAWLDRSGEAPSFVLLNLMEAHSPFHEVPGAARFGVDEPEQVGERTHLAQLRGPEGLAYPRAGEVEDARRLYAAGIRYVDGLVGELLDGLRERGRLRHTVVVVTADHGEAFGAHGFHGHMVGLHAQTLHVPLLLRHPSLPAGRAVGGVVSLADVHPTLVEIGTGRPTPRSLLARLGDADTPSAVVSEQRRPLQVLADFRRSDPTRAHPASERDLSALDQRALRVRLGDRVLLRETPVRGGEPRFSFFDLAVDPTEAHDLWPDPRAHELLPLLEAYDARPVAGSGIPELSIDLRAQLEALGYLGG
ncbi:MAG: sulfatase, partial [Myxococcota bacterium]